MRGAESGYTFDLPALEGLSPFFSSDVPLFPGTYYWVFGNNWDYRDFDFDHDQAGIFALQDEITEAVTIAIAPAVASAEQQRALRKVGARVLIPPSRPA